MSIFAFKGTPAAGEGVDLDGKGDPGMPGAPGFQVQHFREDAYHYQSVSLSIHLFFFFLPSHSPLPPEPLSYSLKPFAQTFVFLLFTSFYSKTSTSL